MEQPLIIFDSGIGGLSILRHLLDLPLPIIYFADQHYFPYGDKSSVWVETRLLELSHQFQAENPAAVVVACNTGTTTAISKMRQILTCPVIGVEPVIKPISAYHNCVIWGTSVTLNSPRALELRQLHGDHIRFYTPHALASAIENQDSELVSKILYQAKIDLGNPDAIGLSCTHYPHITNQIKKMFPDSIILDPSLAVAKQVKKTLNLPQLKIVNCKLKITYNTTGNLLKLKRLAKKYL